jgi:hypothetical protein
MKNIDVKLSVLSKNRSVLGFAFETHRGISHNEKTNQISALSYGELYLGFIFAYIRFSFTFNEVKMESDPKMDKFINMMRDHIDNIDQIESK